MALALRDVVDADLPVFFEFQRDPVASAMAAFVSRDPSDRAAFEEHWRRIRADHKIVNRTIVEGSEVVGSIARFEIAGEPHITYWIGREFWGRGIATRALSAFLEIVTERPLYASAAQDNEGSRRVLEKCGFRVARTEPAFAGARGAHVVEVFFELR